MKIAVTYKDGDVFQHFGKTEEFIICRAENGKVSSHTIVNTRGKGHGALAGFLKDMEADVLICGGIGEGARAALAGAGIKLVPGVSGKALEAAEGYAEGTLKFDENAGFNHHHDGRQCGGHGHGGGHSCGA